MTALTLYPAIDLKGGQCVRLVHGEMEKATVYNEDPAAQARAFADAGFERLHIVDLDGAFSGKSENAAAVVSILKESSASAQLGGGVRDMASIEGWLGKGLTRVILGTAAVRDPALVKAACRAFPGRIAVGIDARDGRVKTDGWAGDSDFTAEEIGKRFEGVGVAGIIYTDISRDGALAGTCMAGYDGHRGWVHLVAVHPEHRRCGVGATLMQRAAELLAAAGCPKLNLQVRAGSPEAVAFYESLGFVVEERVSMGKRLGPRG